MMKRVAVIAAVVVMLAGGTAACGSSDTHAKQEAAPVAEASTTPTPTPTSTPTTSATPSATPKPTPTHKPTPASGPRLFGHGDSGDRIRDLQARLKQIGWFNAGVTGNYGNVTEEAVRGFQAKRGIAVTGFVDQRTLDRLDAMTRKPTKDELTNTPPKAKQAPLDPRCRTGRVICIDKSTRTLRWVIGGDVRSTMDVRFGAEYTPTREGVFSIYTKDRHHVSKLYGSSMPFAMFFSRGEAVHYSSDFAARGYNGASHGCVNVRDYNAIASLYSQVRIGDKVVIYWS
ncbi:MAG: murein L,D-transpeptidase [Nocardioides sp.]|nr:murein L,D-transpeptidase [Nocardioides sp.]